MIIIPAIDLLDGQVVRLSQGERNQATVYDPDPAHVVDRFADAGTHRIHVVDLDGAFEGRPAQRQAIAHLTERARARGVVIQTGGGIRDASTVDALFEAGVDQVVLGTMAVREPTVAEQLCRAYPQQIIVAVDARDDRVAISGWQEDSGVPVHEIAMQAQDWGAGALLHTDVSRDGMRSGPAIEATAALQAKLEIPVYASGGVGTLDHIKACVKAKIRGVIVGRALYEGAFTLEEALAVC